MIRPVGIFSWFGFVLPFEDRIRLIKEAGFTATAIWWEDEEEPYPMKKEDMPFLVRQMGLKIDNIHVPFCDANALWSADEAKRKAMVERHIQWLTDCRQFHIPRMVMHLSEGDNPPSSNDYGLQSMETLVQAAERLGVTLAIENTISRDNVPFLLQGIRSENLGFCFDSSHHRLREQDDYQLLTTYGERMVTTHLSDNDGLLDRHWLPGLGIIDWTNVLKSFPKEYQGCFLLEAYPTAEERQSSPQEFLKRAYLRVLEVRNLHGKTLRQ